MSGKWIFRMKVVWAHLDWSLTSEVSLSVTRERLARKDCLTETDVKSLEGVSNFEIGGLGGGCCLQGSMWELSTMKAKTIYESIEV